MQEELVSWISLFVFVFFLQMGLFLFPQVQQKMNDVEVRETEIFDWKKKVTEAACKLKQHENLLETVVSERNLYSKNLIETQVIAK